MCGFDCFLGVFDVYVGFVFFGIDEVEEIVGVGGFMVEFECVEEIGVGFFDVF